MISPLKQIKIDDSRDSSHACSATIRNCYGSQLTEKIELELEETEHIALPEDDGDLNLLTI